MKQPKGLGRGLDAIFGTDAVDAKLKPMSQMSEIDITEIIPNPTQPRTQFDEEALDELADSIRQLGSSSPSRSRNPATENISSSAANAAGVRRSAPT